MLNTDHLHEIIPMLDVRGIKFRAESQPNTNRAYDLIITDCPNIRHLIEVLDVLDMEAALHEDGLRLYRRGKSVLSSSPGQSTPGRSAPSGPQKPPQGRMVEAQE